MFYDKLLERLEHVTHLLESSARHIGTTLEDEPEDFHLIPVRDDGHAKSVSAVLNRVRVNGLLRICKQTIWDLELAIVEHEPVTRVYRSSFMLDKRWNLLQIHDVQLATRTITTEAQSILGVVKRIAKNASESSTDDSNAPNSADSPQFTANPQHKTLLISLLKSLLDKLVAADNRLSIPARLSLRSLSRSRLRTIFTPPLPTSYLINIYVLNGNFCVDLNSTESLKEIQNKSHSGLSSVFGGGRSRGGAAIVDALSYSASDQKHQVTKCTYEVNDIFHHPYHQNERHMVTNTVQLYTQLPWLAACHNNIKLAKNELFYIMQKIEADEPL